MLDTTSCDLSRCDPFGYISIVGDAKTECPFQQSHRRIHSALALITMFTLRSALLAASLAASVLAAPAPLPTPPPDLSKAKGKRATSCTFSGSDGYSLASVSQADCATIVLSALTVPAGVTLDLSNLEDDTTVSDTGTFVQLELHTVG